jgi:hypothetical protein
MQIDDNDKIIDERDFKKTQLLLNRDKQLELKFSREKERELDKDIQVNFFLLQLTIKNNLRKYVESDKILRPVLI